MCYNYKQTNKARVLEQRFKTEVAIELNLESTRFNGFAHPKAPVITNKNSNTIQLFNWGLIPVWAKDNTIRTKTLNARIETITELPSFKNNVKNRCLIIANGFYEWQWLDEKGKNKQQYLIGLENDEPFAFAGIYSEWVDKTTGEVINTYTIVTTEANSVMAEIHNTKKRMPVILTPENETLWLSGSPVNEFVKPEVELNPVKLS